MSDLHNLVNLHIRKRGRKPRGESRATEIRERLTAWRETPEPFRSSLRALAAEMGTSHQLLSFYLRRWDKWQAKEYQRKANVIRVRADAENRQMTQQEQAQVGAYDRASIHSLLDSVLRDTLPKWLKELREGAKRGKLSRQRLRTARLLARAGYGKEVQILAPNG